MGDSITLHYAKKREAEHNTYYNYKAEVKNLADLLKVCQFDHVGATYQHNHRTNKDFIRADNVMMDLDNNGTENPQEWLKPEDLAKRFPDCFFYAVYSKSNEKFKHKGDEKKERGPRPRYHVYFPLSETVNTCEEFRALKQALRVVAPELDLQAADSARYFNGVVNPSGLTIEGRKCVDTFLREKKLWPIEDTQQKIPVSENDSCADGGHDENQQEKTAPDTQQKIPVSDNGHDRKQEKTAPETWPEQKPEYKPTMQSRFSSINVLEEIGMAIHVGEGHNELLRYANKVLFAYGEINFEGIDIARQLFDLRTRDYEGTCPPEHFEKIWDAAIQRFRTRKDWDWKNPTKKALERAKKLLKKISKKEADEENAEKKKKPLSLRAVESALSEIGVVMRLNAITREAETTDLPTDNKFMPLSYRKATGNTRNNANLAMLPLFLTSYLRDSGFAVNGDYLTASLNALTIANPYNPFHDMLNAGEWDHVDRILPVARAIHIDTLDYHYLIYFTKWLHQVVSMALNDDGRLANDFVLVLQGAQHIGKTSIFRKLAMSPDWFCEGATLNVNDKDSVMRATRVLICELGELDATLDKEQAALKAFITNTFDRYRAPYGKSIMKYERRTTFCATVNPDEFLRDRTGNKRFVVIPVKERLDTDFIYNVMTPDYVAQLWRQIYQQRYIAGGRESFRLTQEESDFSERQNRAYQVKLNGEIELLDMLDWDKPEENWRLWNLSELITVLHLPNTVTTVKLGTALRSMMNKDSRIKKKKTKERNLYLLPPKRGDFSEEKRTPEDFTVLGIK